MKIALITGEASGDFLAASVAKKFYEIDATIQLVGVTGRLMKDAGVRTWVDNAVFNVMGISDVIFNLRSILAARKEILQNILKENPDVVVGVDAPDLNLTLAQTIRKMGIPYVQYVCPSFWLWRKERVAIIKRSCDLVLLLFPYEKKYCDLENINNEFVGHPLVDEINNNPLTKSEARAQLGYRDQDKVIALFPGSRKQEINAHKKLFENIIAYYSLNKSTYKFAWAPLNSKLLSKVNKGDIYPGKARAVLAAADVALIKSGTITLEALLLNCPQVMIYRTDFISGMFAKNKLGDLSSQYFSLPNLISNKLVINEYVQNRIDIHTICEELIHLIKDHKTMQEDYAKIKKELIPNAAMNAAKAIMNFVQKKS